MPPNTMVQSLRKASNLGITLPLTFIRSTVAYATPRSSSNVVVAVDDQQCLPAL